MATKKFLEIKEMADVDLANELAETQAQYQKQQFDHAIKGLDNPILLREIRRDIARFKSQLRRREEEQMSVEDVAKRDRIRRRRRK